MSLTTEEICKIICENWRFPPGWEMDKMVVGKPREGRYITYNIPSGVIYFFPKEADAIDFSKDQIAPPKPYGFQDLVDDMEKNLEKAGQKLPGAKYALLESIPESEAEKTEKCKHNGHYGFDSLLQRCRDCGMSAIDIEIEQSGDVMIDGESVIVSSMPWKSSVEMGAVGEKVEETKKNYCAPGDIFSQCKAGMNWKDHQKCRFSEKASRASRCMYFRNLNGTKHCDNHLAQKALYLSANDNRLVPNE